MWDDRVFYSDLVDVTGSFWGDGVIWSDNLFDPGSVIWTDSFFDPGSVIWSDFFDSVIWADFFDSVIWADSVIWSDDPANSTEGDSAINAGSDPSFATTGVRGVFWSDNSTLEGDSDLIGNLDSKGPSDLDTAAKK